MKILQVNCVYKKGSTGKITNDIHTELSKRNIESVVCYGRGTKVKDINIYKICGEFYSNINHFNACVTGVLYGGCNYSTCKLISIIKCEKPDVVHLQCLNGFFVNIYKLIHWLKVNRIRTVVTLHAEFMYTGGCGHSLSCNKWIDLKGCRNCARYHTEMKSLFFDRSFTMWNRMKNSFEGFEDRLIITSVSPWLKERALLSPILRSKEHCVVYNGINTDEIFHMYGEEITNKLKHDLCIKNESIIIHVTPIFNDDPDHIKGGYYILQLAKLMTNVKFIIVGKVKEGLKIPPNMILLGKLSDQNKLAKLYSMADLTVISSQKETFSMVTAETLCCGTPIVGFKAGAPEMIAIKEFSEFVEYGNLTELKKAAERMMKRNIDRNKIVKQTTVYSKEVMVDNYINIYKRLINKK